MVRTSFLDYPCLDAVQRIYVHLGTNQGSVIYAAGILGPTVTTVGPAYFLNSAEMDLLGALGQSGIHIYIEGGSHWSYDHAFGLFDERDGVNTDLLVGPGFIATFEGDDSLTAIDGASAFPDLDLGGLQDFSYLQDDVDNDDFTDQLPLASGVSADPAGVAAVVARIDDALVPTPADAYAVMIALEATDGGGNTVSSSFEFGGIEDPAARMAVAEEILFFFGAERFRRGDMNSDGLLDIGDAIGLLSALLPPPGGPVPTINCDDAVDVNDDGMIDLADPIFLLSILFPPPGNPSLPPPIVCGFDPTLDPLGCASYLAPGCP